MLALLLWAVNGFLWDAAVSSREATKDREGEGCLTVPVISANQEPSGSDEERLLK